MRGGDDDAGAGGGAGAAGGASGDGDDDEVDDALIQAALEEQKCVAWHVAGPRTNRCAARKVAQPPLTSAVPCGCPARAAEEARIAKMKARRARKRRRGAKRKKQPQVDPSGALAVHK